jgi:hypothetical protein
LLTPGPITTSTTTTRISNNSNSNSNNNSQSGQSRGSAPCPFFLPHCKSGEFHSLNCSLHPLLFFMLCTWVM